MDEFRAWIRLLNFFRERGIPDDLGYALEDYDKELLGYLWCVSHPEEEECSVRRDWHDFGCVVVKDPGREERRLVWICGIVTPMRECVEAAVGEYLARYGGLRRSTTITIEWIPRCDRR